MKRYFKKFKNWFYQWFVELKWQEKIGFIFGGLLGILSFVTMMVTIDIIPATPEDYKPLEEMALEVQTTPGLLLDTNCNIIVEDETITVVFENKECKVNAKYTKNFELLSILRSDNSTFWLGGIFLAIMAGFCVYAFGTFAITVLISAVCFLISLYYEKKGSKKR